MRTPLLEWNYTSMPGEILHKENYQEIFTEELMPRLPFEAFRVNGTYITEGVTEWKFKAWISQGVANGGAAYQFFLEHVHLRVLGGSPVRPQSKVFAGIVTGAGLQCLAMTQDGKGFQVDAENADIRRMICRTWVEMLAIDFQNPHLQLVKKSPPQVGGKSVEWQKAREHYVFLHKSHGANKKAALGTRPVVEGDTLKRMAHSRRAHFRTLIHPRFGKNQGQRVFVKSSWVGPKEWTDRSGQIYRIVDLPAAEA